jgi:predicted MFS family arabinose efflux permease
MTPSLAMGQTMNHVAAVAIPVAGGLLWNRYGYQAPFWAGVVAAIVSLLMTQGIPHQSRRVVPTAEPLRDPA